MSTIELKDPSLLRQQCYINGTWRDANSGETIDVTNPANGAVIGTVPNMGAEETREAIEHARIAQLEWRKKLAKERSVILRRWYELMMENQDDLALLMTMEQGKPLAEAKGEIAYSASFIEWFADECRRIHGETIPEHQADKRIVVIKQPVGVCVAITPWNFPSAMITRKVGPALAAGCAVVVKPATQTPLSAFALCELAERAGLPAGLMSVLTGSSREIGGEMTSNPTVRHLSFTGSTEVGRLLMRQCSDSIIKVALELLTDLEAFPLVRKSVLNYGVPDMTGRFVEDLEGYEAVWRTPITGTYKGYEFISMPPPSSGGVAIAQLFNAVEPYELQSMDFHSVESMHVIIESERRVYADRAEHLG